jgi:hypothetical protein
MSLQHKIGIVNRVEKLVSELKIKYTSHSSAAHELTKMNEALKGLNTYLSKLDALQPDYTTNEVEKYMKLVDLNLAILKSELEKPDYMRLQKNVLGLAKILKFHPTKYNFFESFLIWVYELIYFV